MVATGDGFSCQPSLRGTYMTRLREFIHQADAEMLHNRDLARSLASEMSPDGPRGARRQEPADIAPRCKSRRALSPSPASPSATAPASESVATPGFSSRRYGRRATSPIDLALPRSAAKDFQPGRFNLCGLQHRRIRLLRLRWPLNPCASNWILCHLMNRRQAQGAFQ